ncbi:MAG TPA: type II toxin-antitoxin system VapC family toxin [Solirubrobacterales bacterium]
MAVIDASVLVTLFTGREDFDWVEKQLLVDDTRRSLWAPHLIDAEVGHSLRRLVAAGEMEDDHAAAALGDLATMQLRRIVHTDLLARAWQLRHNLSFYDGLYVALAEMLETSLITLDIRLARAAAKTAGIDVLTV